MVGVRILFRGLSDGGVDGTGGPGCGLGYEAAKESLGGGADVIASLGMPLNTDNKVDASTFGGLATLYGFDDGILGAAGRDAETVTGDSDSLMMAGVDGQTKVALLLGRLFAGDKGAEERAGGDCGGVGDGDAAACGMVDREDGQILNQGSSAPDIERLKAETDGEERFIEVVGVLEEEFVYVFPGIVGRSALWDGFLAVFVRIDIGWASGEEDGLAGVDEIDDLGGGGMERNLDGFAAGALDCGGVLGPGGLIVGEVGAGRQGDSDARLH
jgi:hypothetical protein